MSNNANKKSALANGLDTGGKIAVSVMPFVAVSTELKDNVNNYPPLNKTVNASSDKKTFGDKLLKLLKISNNNKLEDTLIHNRKIATGEKNDNFQLPYVNKVDTTSTWNQNSEKSPVSSQTDSVSLITSDGKIAGNMTYDSSKKLENFYNKWGNFYNNYFKVTEADTGGNKIKAIVQSYKRQSSKFAGMLAQKQQNELDELVATMPESDRVAWGNYTANQKVIDDEELRKAKDPEGIGKKHGLDVLTLTEKDWEKYAISQGWKYYTFGEDDSEGISQTVLLSPEVYEREIHGYGATKEERMQPTKLSKETEEIRFLRVLAQNNDRIKKSGENLGGWTTVIDAFGNGATFGLSTFASNKKAEKAYKAAYGNTANYVSPSQAMAKTYNDNQFAYVGGNIAGTVLTSWGVGALVKGGIKKLGMTFAKKWMEPAIVQGVTSSLRGGVTEFSAGGNLKDIFLNASREGFTGTIAGAVGSKVESAVASALTNSKYAGKILNKIKNMPVSDIGVQTIGGIADATADYAADNVFVGVANKFGANLEYRTGTDLATDFAVSMLFNFGGGLNIKNRAEFSGKITRYLDDYDSYRTLLRSDVDAETKIKAGEKLLKSGNEISKFIDENISTGKNDTVDLLKNSIDVVNDTLNINNKLNRAEQNITAEYNTNNYDVDLAIGNIMDGKATIEDFKLFEPGNTENRQLFYETTGMKLPENSQLSYYRLINLNNRNRMFNLYSNHNALNVDNLTLPEYRKHLEKQNVDTKIKDLYLKHNNRLKNSDSLTANGEGGIIKKNNASLSQTEYTYVKKETGWSDDVVNYIRTLEEADVYINAGLKEVQVGDRKVLIRSDIDLDMVTPEGDTNRERMNKGKAPYTKSGEKIELHHIGQKNESPLAELAKTEHRGKGRHGKLHNLKMKSKVDHDNFNSDREMYWKERLKNMELEEKLYE